MASPGFSLDCHSTEELKERPGLSEVTYVEAEKNDEISSDVGREMGRNSIQI